MCDKIISMPQSAVYAAGWERVFGKGSKSKGTRRVKRNAKAGK